MICRARQIAWTLAHLRDLDADFLRFYGREWWQMTGPEFFARAARVSAYGGVMTAILRAEQAEAEQVATPPTFGEQVQQVPLRALLSDPALRELVEIN
ncbi:MAG TPA: hypothetical protein VFU47_12930 [Armatimonadota bacterium]|nr:hypothetical protein [Armatimonadota bacterium]